MHGRSSGDLSKEQCSACVSLKVFHRLTLLAAQNQISCVFLDWTFLQINKHESQKINVCSVSYHVKYQRRPAYFIFHESSLLSDPVFLNLLLNIRKMSEKAFELILLRYCTKSELSKKSKCSMARSHQRYITSDGHQMDIG